jgi:hypothetical protein
VLKRSVPTVPTVTKFHPTSTGLAVADTGPGRYDAIRFALSLPPGNGVIVELRHDGPYRRGIFPGEPNPKKLAGVTCPYCQAPVLLYEYEEFGFGMFICRDVGFFMRLPADPLSREDWVRVVRQPAKTWTEIEANEKGGRYGGRS